MRGRDLGQEPDWEEPAEDSSQRSQWYAEAPSQEELSGVKELKETSVSRVKVRVADSLKDLED